MTATLDGKVAYVTAAAGAGIGRAIAFRLASAGAKIVLTDLHADRTEASAAVIAAETGSEVLGLQVDVTSEDAVRESVTAALDAFGAIDILVNNSGMTRVGPMWELSLDAWHRVMDVCLTAHFLTMREILPHMIERRSGSIVNIASIAGWVPWGAPGGEAAYHAAKAGVMALTRTVALEVAPHGIRVNAVAPGLTMNPFLAKANPEEYLAEITAQVPLGRANQPEDIANSVHFLVSDKSAMTTGEVLNVSGGLFMRP